LSREEIVGFLSAFAAAFLQGQILRAKVFLGVVAAVCLIGGTWYLTSSSMHTIHGVGASALLVDRFDTCMAEFKPRGESRRKEAMPCEHAYALQSVHGSNKVKVTKKTAVLVRFPLGDGTLHEVKVDESMVRAGGVRVGDPLAVVYDPRSPKDVRGKLTWQHVQMNLLVIFAGLVALLLLFAGRVLRFVGSLPDRRGPAKQPDDAPAGTSWGDEALNRAIEARAKQAAAARQPPVVVRTSDRRMVGGARRQFGVKS
jgi:hypothetical protein